MMVRSVRVGLLSALMVLAVAATDNAAADQADDFIKRVELLALLQTFNADLLSHDSATATLERWCEVHHIAAVPRVTARLVAGAASPASPAQRQLLGVGDNEPVQYRHVSLSCGTHVLSEADNWYVPSRLTPEMNRLLTETETPFGKAVAALHFHRQTLTVQLLWSPLPEHWEMDGPGAVQSSGHLTIPAQILQHQAVLKTPDGTPFSEVIETYTSEILHFDLPR